MATIDVVRYFINSMQIGGSILHGVTTATVTRSTEMTTLITKGSPNITANFEKKPNINLSFSRYLTSSQYTNINAQNKVGSSRPSVEEISFGVVGGAGFKLNDMRIKSLSFNFPNEGNFTEQVSYEGVTNQTPSAFFKIDPPESGIVLRRKDFAGGSFPTEVSGKRILSVEASVNINYGHIPTWGNFYTNYSSYVSVPLDISCTFEVLDLGQNNSLNDLYTNADNGQKIFTSHLSNSSIVINSGGPTIDLGGENFLSNIERSGGDAGQNNYSVYKVTYKNTNNYFTVS
jgi:hypothetical protein